MSPALPTFTPDSTPICVLKESIAQRNAARMLDRCRDLGVTFRPHVKTHKTLEGALLQTGGLRSRIVVSTLSELSFYLSHDFTDILYGVPLAPNRFRSICQLARNSPEGAIGVLFDHPDQHAAFERTWSEFADLPRVSAFIMVGSELAPSSAQSLPMHQAGLSPSSHGALQLALSLSQSCSCELRGCYTHAAHAYSALSSSDCAEAVATRDRGARIQG